MNALEAAFYGSLLVAGVASVLTYLGWLAIQWTAQLHYLFEKEVSDEKRDRH